MEYTIKLPEEWSEENELAVVRDRPDNGRGTPTILRIVESVGDADSTLSSQFYIIREPAMTSPEIVASADTREEAKTELIDAARDHY